MKIVLKHAAGIAIAAALACLFAATVLAAEPYKVARKTAADTYKMDKEGCQAVKGQERKNCMRIAKEKYEQELEQIKTDKARK